MDLFDAVTEDAVRDYAERHGLDFDAIIGDASRNFVGELATKLPAATPDEIEALVDAEMKMDDLPARLAAGLQEAHAETE